MAINGLGAEKRIPERPVPSLPTITLPDIDTAAAGAAKRRQIVRAGSDAWRLIDKSQSFDAWKKIGAALAVGKAHALDVTRANAAWGSAYSKVFSQWMQHHGFGQMPKSTRSVAIELHENIASIEAWRATLTEKQKQRLQGPQQNVRRWRRATATHEAKCRDDVKRAEAAWRHFLACMQTLSPEQQAPLWQAVQTQASEKLDLQLVVQCNRPMMASASAIA